MDRPDGCLGKHMFFPAVAAFPSKEGRRRGLSKKEGAHRPINNLRGGSADYTASLLSREKQKPTPSLAQLEEWPNSLTVSKRSDRSQP